MFFVIFVGWTVQFSIKLGRSKSYKYSVFYSGVERFYFVVCISLLSTFLLSMLLLSSEHWTLVRQRSEVHDLEVQGPAHCPQNQAKRAFVFHLCFDHLSGLLFEGPELLFGGFSGSSMRGPGTQVVVFCTTRHESERKFVFGGVWRRLLCCF